MKKIISVQKDNRGKWMPNYEGPCVVKRTLPGGTLILTRMDGEELPLPVNSDSVKKFYALYDSVMTVNFFIYILCNFVLLHFFILKFKVSFDKFLLFHMLWKFFFKIENVVSHLFIDY